MEYSPNENGEKTPALVNKELGRKYSFKIQNTKMRRIYNS